MRKDEIEIGGIYTHNRNVFRLVVDMGPQYNSNDDREWGVNYAVLSNGLGRQANMPLSEFAAWAKEKIE